MTEMAQGEVSAADTLRHIADDHPCCAAGLLDAAARIEALEKDAETYIKETAARLVAALRSLADEIEGDLAALAQEKPGLVDLGGGLSTYENLGRNPPEKRADLA